MRELDLTVVILNYNGGALLTEVVAAALASETLQLGVVVVDNGSTDDSLQRLATIMHTEAQQQSRNTLILKARSNLGFAAGNNMGLFGLAARHVALLNNDALVAPSTLPTLVQFLDRYPEVAACAPRLTWPDGRTQPFGYGADPSPRYLLRRALAQRQGRYMHDWDGSAPHAVAWVAGTCMVIRTGALTDVGLLDERIFMYFEDNDLCLRMRQRGWKVYYVPEVTARHYNRPAKGDSVRVANYYTGLSRFYRRHYGPVAAVAVRVASAARLWWLRRRLGRR